MGKDQSQGPAVKEAVKESVALVGGLDVHDVDPLPRMLLPDMRVNLGGLLAPEVAVRTHVSRLVAALVLEVPVAVALEGEAAVALGAVVLFLSPLRPPGESSLVRGTAAATATPAASTATSAAASAAALLDEAHEGVYDLVCKQRTIQLLGSFLICFYWVSDEARVFFFLFIVRLFVCSFVR
jgi:hypothetical protein